MCIAEVKILASNAQQCSIIVQQALSSEIVYPEELLTDVLGVISIEGKCESALNKICENKSSVGVVQDDSDMSDLLDPADRGPSILSDEQKLKSYRLENFQNYSVKVLLPRSLNRVIN